MDLAFAKRYIQYLWSFRQGKDYELVERLCLRQGKYEDAPSA
jgi:hypothetical protein